MLTGATQVRSMAAAGVGVIRGVLRRTPPVNSAEQLLCNSSRPVSALISSSSLTAKATAAMENELVMEAGEPVPRLIFGDVPSLQEAEEATTELKAVLDEIYQSSPKPFELETSLIPGISMPLNTEIVENRSGVILENNTCNPRHKQVLQAFSLLHEIPETQTIIASIASDHKVFNAMLENSEVKKLIHKYQTSKGSDTFEDEANVTQEGDSGGGVMEKFRNLKDFVINIPIHLPDLFGSSAVESTSGSDHKENTTMKDGKSGSGFLEKLRNLKNSVVEMATNIPNYLPNLYGFSAVKSASGSDHKGNTQSSPPELGLGTSLTGLAIMVIMIVLFKRV